MTIRILLLLLSVSLARGAENVTLGWDPNTESDLNGYKIYYGPASANYTNTVDVGDPDLRSGELLQAVAIAQHSAKLATDHRRTGAM